MPSKNSSEINIKEQPKTIFITLLFLSLILWFLYRGLFNFSVLFDESLGKAIFFGLPIWIYINVTGSRAVIETMKPSKIFSGLLRGVALGGVFGFVAIGVSIILNQGEFAPAPLFVLDQFWWEFFLALLTSFWESLFFYSFIQTVLGTLFKTDLSVWQRVLLTSLLFLLFHLPNTILRFNGLAISAQIVLLYLFALGQAILFSKEKNVYTLILSQTIWGMVLLVHF